MFAHQTNVLIFFTCDPEAEPRGILLSKNVIIYDINGRELIINECNESELNIDFKIFPKGVYLLKITNINGNTISKKVVKK